MIDRQRRSLKQFSDELEAQAARWSAAGNTVRASILYLLHAEKELCPCDISDILGMSVPAVSQHLKRMREADLIVGRRDGVMIFYALSPAGRPLAEEMDMNIRNENILS
ncbi:MAG: metalloregulator ArsR/SmtB family transcription factor [Flavobacteriales bacterium]|nr:metalloregulator ArsR/SmtB family transcription factor [Flavobacteriales bacterium]